MASTPWRLRGGLVLPGHKEASTARPILQPPLPPRLCIPLRQHGGVEARPVVGVGDCVLKGQLIGAAADALATPVHASTSGRVVALATRPLDGETGSSLCIEIEPDGQDRWLAHQGCADYRGLTPMALQALIRDAGIAGLGGAGFPTHARLPLDGSAAIDTVIVNALECEPYISADDRLIRERAADVVDGARIVRHLLGATRIVFGIEEDKAAALRALNLARAGSVDIEVQPVPARYPSGASRLAVYLLTGRETPRNGHTPAVGVFNLNAGTAAAIKRAVVDGEPLISRIVTVTGPGVDAPVNVDARLGTPARWLLTQARARFDAIDRLIIGGPMMGRAAPSLDVPVTKTTNCLLAATPAAFPAPAPEQACIRCGECAEVCPVDLLPQQLYWHARAGELDRAARLGLSDCIECGACAYVCPSRIPLVSYYRDAKAGLAEQAAAVERADRARRRFEQRQARLLGADAERAARRQARLQAPPVIITPVGTPEPADPLPGVTAPTPPSTPAGSTVKSPTVAAALARTNLKKAEKRLAAATMAGEDTAALQADIVVLQAEVARTEAAVAQARSPAP